MDKELIVNWRGVQVRSATFVLILGSAHLAGCAASGHRNTRDALVVTAPASLAEGEVTFSLELRNERQAFTLDQADAFLASGDAARLSGRMRRLVRTRADAVRSTLPAARKQLEGGIAIIRPGRQRRESGDNFVVYLESHDGVRLLFDPEEIRDLLAFRELADDLSTIRYTHPGFDDSRLRLLHDRACTMDLGVSELTPSQRELQRLRDEAATRVVERTLRAQHVDLPSKPLLESGTFHAATSPKLSEALRDRDAFEALIKSGDLDAIRAVIHLIRRDMVDIEYP